MVETGNNKTPEVSKETKEVEPNITVDFFFSPHGSEEDFKRLPAILKEADVFIPEALGWTTESEKKINQIAQGILTPEEAGCKDATAIIEHLIYSSQIPVTYIDVPPKHPSIREFFDGEEEIDNATEYFIQGEFDKALKQIKKGCSDLAAAIKSREQFIIEKLQEKLQTLTTEFPQLKNKENIRVLVQFGSIHTPIYKESRHRLLSSKIILGNGIEVFGFQDEITRRINGSLQPTIDDEIYSKCLVEQIFHGFIYEDLNDVTQDNNKIIWTIRKLISKLSMQQIHLLSEKLGDISDTIKTRDEAKKLIIQLLEEIGIKIPQTLEEIDELLDTKKYNYRT